MRIPAVRCAVAAVAVLTAVALAIPQTAPVSAQQDAQEEETMSGTNDRFFMLNALWFKPDGGVEKYREYMNAASPLVEQYGGKGHDAYIPEVSLIGDFDADLIFFVEWPSEDAFTRFVQDPGYQAISHLREEAITDSLLVKCRPMQ